MTKQPPSSRINLLLKQGEGLIIEFKKSYTTRIAEDFVAFANTRGGTLLLGVRDDGKVVGEKLTNSVKANIKSIARNCSPSIEVEARQVGEVVEITIPEGREKPYQCSSGYFRRVDGASQKMSTKELRLMFQRNDDSFEEQICPGARIKDISKAKITEFMKNSGISRTNVRVQDFLTSLKMMREGEITNAAVLLFAYNPRNFISQCQLTCIRFEDPVGVDIFDRMDEGSDLITQFNTAMLFIKKHLNRRSIIEGTYRRDVYDVPEAAFREALANAIIHRDYSVKGSDLMIRMFDDRLEIINPGSLPEGLKKSDFGKVSLRRNEMICDVFHRLDLVEKAGTGISRITNVMKQEDLSPPKIDFDRFFCIRLDRAEAASGREGVQEKFGEKVRGKRSGKTAILSQKEAKNAAWKNKFGEKVRGKNLGKILELISNNSQITIPELAKDLNVTTRAVEKNIALLKGEGLLERLGPAKGGRWKVIF